MIKVELVNPFLEAAFEVFNTEIDQQVERGPLSLMESAVTSQEVNVILGVTGSVQGQIIYSFSQETAKNIAAVMIGQPVPVMDELAQSAICELGNMISGLATMKLERQYSNLAITPPTLIIGTNIFISTLNINRLCVSLISKIGDIELAIALQEK